MFFAIKIRIFRKLSPDEMIISYEINFPRCYCIENNHGEKCLVIIIIIHTLRFESHGVDVAVISPFPRPPLLKIFSWKAF